MIERIKDMEIDKLTEQLKDLKTNGFKAQEDFERQLLIIKKEYQNKYNSLMKKNEEEKENQLN